MDLVIIEDNKPYVLEALGNGDFDYIEGAGEVFETDFFRFIKAKSILKKLAESYPTPRKKEEVPLWFYVASNLSMRLHGEHSFNSFPLIVRCGGMLNAFGPKVGRKVVHPDTGDITIACEGFNKKNHYERQTPCDQDYLRKVSKDTDADALMRWFCNDVVRVFRSRRAYDKEGIFIGDGSYLFVPDNPNYEGSAKLLFDEHDHPISQKAYEEMSNGKKARCQWRRCYKMVTLLHTNRSMDYFLFVAVKVVSGKDHECPVLYNLVKQFVESIGKGVMKRLILDRAFLDGQLQGLGSGSLQLIWDLFIRCHDQTAFATIEHRKIDPQNLIHGDRSRLEKYPRLIWGDFHIRGVHVILGEYDRVGGFSHARLWG